MQTMFDDVVQYSPCRKSLLALSHFKNLLRHYYKCEGAFHRETFSEYSTTVFYNIVKHPLHICISCSPQIEEIASSVCFYLKVTHGTTALRGHGLGYWPGNADYFLDNILEKMIIVSFDKCMCARIPLPAMKVKISRRGGRAVQRARAGNITANTNKHFSNQNQIKWQNALNLHHVRLNITIYRGS